MKHSLQSIEEIRQALEGHTMSQWEVITSSEDFLRKAVMENLMDARKLLIDIVKTGDGTAIPYAIAWLAEFRDPELLPFFVEVLEHRADYGLQAIHAMMKLGNPHAIGPLLQHLPKATQDEREAILSTLSHLKALDTIDIVASYLDHSQPSTRIAAMLSFLRLVELSGRRDLARKVFPLLRDPVSQVRQATSVLLEADFPDILSDYHSVSSDGC